MVNLNSIFDSKNCILFSTADWDDPYWTNKQHVASELAKQGWKVLYVESVGLRSPRSNSQRDWHRLFYRAYLGIKSLVCGARKSQENVWVISPLVLPGMHDHPIFSYINNMMLNLLLFRTRLGLNISDGIVWTYHPFISSVLRGKWKRFPLVYHCVDDLSAVPGIDAKKFVSAEDDLLKLADIVFTTTLSLTERCQQVNKKTFYYPNVVDAEHFFTAFRDQPSPAEVIDIPSPRLVYHGVLSDFKIDFKLLLDVMKKKPDWSLVLIGGEREGQSNNNLKQLSELGNVYLLGYRSYEDLPYYLMAMDVGLLPSLINKYTDGMFPMKFYEYQASGLPVVSTKLKFTEQAQGEFLVANNGDDFIAAIKEQLCRGKLTLQEAERCVGSNTWKDRTREMLSIIKNNLK